MLHKHLAKSVLVRDRGTESLVKVARTTSSVKTEVPSAYRSLCNGGQKQHELDHQD